MRATPPAWLSASDLDRAERSPVRCIDPDAEAAMIAEIEAAKRDRDTLGGVTEVRAFGVPPGPRLLRRGRRAPRRAARRRDALDPVGQGRRDRRRDRIGRAARLERARRDLPHGREGLAPRDGPRRRHRGRDDQRRRGGRAHDLEAAADADAPAAVGRARLARAARGPRRALGRHRASRPRRSSPRRRSRGSWRGRPARSSAATRSATSPPPTPPTSSASPGHDPRARSATSR